MDLTGRQYKTNCKKIFDEIEDKRNHLVRMEENSKKRRLHTLELLSLKQQHKVLTEEEWERTRDTRIAKWKKFQFNKKKIGSKGTDYSIRIKKREYEEILKN